MSPHGKQNLRKLLFLSTSCNHWAGTRLQVLSSDLDLICFPRLFFPGIRRFSLLTTGNNAFEAHETPDQESIHLVSFPRLLDRSICLCFVCLYFIDSLCDPERSHASSKRSSASRKFSEEPPNVRMHCDLLSSSSHRFEGTG